MTFDVLHFGNSSKSAVIGEPLVVQTGQNVSVHFVNKMGISIYSKYQFVSQSIKARMWVPLMLAKQSHCLMRMIRVSLLFLVFSFVFISVNVSSFLLCFSLAAVGLFCLRSTVKIMYETHSWDNFSEWSYFMLYSHETALHFL